MGGSRLWDFKFGAQGSGRGGEVQFRGSELRLQSLCVRLRVGSVLRHEDFEEVLWLGGTFGVYRSWGLGFRVEVKTCTRGIRRLHLEVAWNTCSGGGSTGSETTKSYAYERVQSGTRGINRDILQEFRC